MKLLKDHQPEILLITSKDDLATDLLVVELKQKSCNFLRINIEDFPAKICMSWMPLAEKKFTLNKKLFSLNNIKSAWYRKNYSSILPTGFYSEGVKEFVHKNIGLFLEGFWESNDWFWVNKPSKVQLSENKLLQLTIAKKLNALPPK